MPIWQVCEPLLLTSKAPLLQGSVVTACSQWHTTILSSPMLMVSAFVHTELREIQVLGPGQRRSSIRRIATTQMNLGAGISFHSKK